MTDAVGFAVKTALFGVSGWIVENIFAPPRFSPVFGNVPVPFLPVYAVGGATVMTLAPALAPLPWFARAAIYAFALSGVEFLGCQFNRQLLDACSWDYSDRACARPFSGCVDVKHALLWGVLGLAAEGLDRLTQRRYRRRRAMA